MSAPHFIDVVPGFKLKDMMAGDPTMPTRVHQFTLLSLNRDRGDRLFLRIEDKKRSQLYGVYHLGRLVRITEPQMEMDGKGHLHVSPHTHDRIKSDPSVKKRVEALGLEHLIERDRKEHKGDDG